MIVYSFIASLFSAFYLNQPVNLTKLNTTAHTWCDGHTTSISTCRVWGVRAGVQVSRRKFHTHIHLDQTRVEILSCIKKRKLNKENFKECTTWHNLILSNMRSLLLYIYQHYARAMHGLIKIHMQIIFFINLLKNK